MGTNSDIETSPIAKRIIGQVDGSNLVLKDSRLPIFKGYVISKVQQHFSLIKQIFDLSFPINKLRNWHTYIMINASNEGICVEI